MHAVTRLSAQEIARLVRTGQVSPVEVVEQTLGRITDEESTLNAFASLDAEGARVRARQLEKTLAQGGDPGPLAGVPVGVKDVEHAAGLATTFGAPCYRNNVAAEDSVQVARLKAAGAIVVGKTTTPEFAYTLFTKNRLHGVTRNPWDRERTPGGSSGGSAAAVTAGLVALATGTDAGGSVRQPAAYCGCVGFKPSRGRIPAGAFPGPLPLLTMHPFSESGPLARTVVDAALYLDCVAGYHPSDPGSLPPPKGSYVQALGAPLPPLKIAFSPTLGRVRPQAGVLEAVERAVGVFDRLGHRVEVWEGELPDTSAAWSRVLDCDLYAQLQRDFEERPQELSRSLVAGLERARSFALADLLEAQRAFTELNRVVRSLFERCDLLVTPTTPNVAFAASGPPPADLDGRPAALFDLLGFTQPFNVSGQPCVSVPAGFTAAGLPAGLQLVGGRHCDELVLRAARAYEEANPWAQWSPRGG